MVKNKICLITGASGGIGGALAKNLESEGYSLILHGRNKQNLSKYVLFFFCIMKYKRFFLKKSMIFFDCTKSSINLC